MHAAKNQLLKNSKLKWWTEQTSKGQVPKSWLQGLKKLRLRYAFESLGRICKKRLHFWSQSLFPDTYLGTGNHNHFRKSYNQAKDMNSNSPWFKKNSRVSNVNKTTGVCPQAACHPAHSCLLVKQVPIPSEAALAHRTTFSGFPGVGRLPPSAGLPTWNVILWTLYPAGGGEPSKVTDVSSQGWETA